MRITLSNKRTVDQDQLRKKNSVISTSYKVAQDLRKKITAPGSKLEREPVSRSKFTSKTQSISSSGNASRVNINSNVKARISSTWESSSSHVKPRISRVTGPEDIDRDSYSQQKPIARKRIAGPNNVQHGNTEVEPGYSSQRKRMHFEEELPA